MGDHIRFCRIQRKLYQSQVANQIGVTTDTITNWELNRSIPQIRYMPQIISFLNYVPIQNGEPNVLKERLKLFRLMHGVSLKRLSLEIGIDESILAKIESDIRVSTITGNKITSFFENKFKSDNILSPPL